MITISWHLIMLIALIIIGFIWAGTRENEGSFLSARGVCVTLMIILNIDGFGVAESATHWMPIPEYKGKEE